MGYSTDYRCQNCDFEIEDGGLMYFVDEETNCVVEHAMGMLTFDMGDNSKIKGKVISSFCPDCLSEVHFYHNDDDSYVDEIKDCLKNNEKEFVDRLDEKYILRHKSSVLKGAISGDKTHAECPKCGKNIKLIIDDLSECPKCGGMVIGVSFLYD